MENREYLICAIANGNNPQYGGFIYVEALPADGKAPLNPNWDTDIFYLPRNTDVEELLSLAKQHRIWTPEVSEFGFRYIPDREKMRNMLTHIHKSILEFETEEESYF